MKFKGQEYWSGLPCTSPGDLPNPEITPVSPVLQVDSLLLNFIAFGTELYCIWNFPCGSEGKESSCNVGDPGSVPEWGRPPGEGNSNSLQYFYLENSIDRGAQ